MDNPFIYVVLNGELNMSPGKAAAQAVHAVAALTAEQSLRGFTNQTKRTVIVLEAINQQQMDNLEMYLVAMDLPVASYIDEGSNEVLAYSVTALACGPLDSQDLLNRSVFSALPLYRGQKRKWFRKWHLTKTK